MERNVMDVSKWNLLVGREARAMGVAQADDGSVLRFGDEVFEVLYAGEGEAIPEAKQDAKRAAFSRTFHAEAQKVPAWERLVDTCRGDALATAVAVEQVLATIKPAEQDPANAPPKPKTPPARGQALRRAQQATPEDKLRRQILAAASKAEHAVDEAREAAAGLEGVGGYLPGNGSGQGGGMDVATVRRLIDGLKRNPRLKRIADLAGRLRRIAAMKRRQKVSHAADEISDVEQGGDLSRLLPSESVKLASPLLRLALLRDVLERQAVQYRLSGREVVGRGPVVVCIDKSGSMEGARDEWATAVALAMLGEAQRQRRPFAMIAFDSRVKECHVVQVGGALPEAALMIGATGGTDIECAMRKALDVIAGNRTTLGKADVVLITDGGSDTSNAAAIRQACLTLKVQVIGLGIGVEKAWLAPWCDQVHAIHRLDTVEDAAAEALFAGSDE